MIKSKFTIGFLTLAIGTLVGATSVVNTAGATNVPKPPATQENCKKGGWESHTGEDGKPFKNQGQCIKWFNQHGYGGNENGDINVGVDVNTDIKGNDNIVTNVVNFIFGTKPTGDVTADVSADTKVEGDGNFISNAIHFVFG